MLGGQPRERRLARAGRAEQHHRVRLAGLERGPQRRALAEQVLLADEVRPASAGACARRAGRSAGGAATCASSGGSSGASNRRSIAASMVARRAPSGPAHRRSLREWGRIGADRLRRAAGAHRAAARARGRAARLDPGARVRGRQRRLPAAARARPRRRCRIYCARRVAGNAGALAGGLAFILPGLRPDARDRGGRAAGRPAGVGRAGSARGGRGGRRRRRPGRARSSRAASVARRRAARAGARARLRAARRARRPCAVGPFVVLVLLACGLIELAWRRRGRAAVHAWPLALPLAAAGAAELPALAWTALKVGALSYGGGFVIVPLMQGDALDHDWLTAGRVRQRGRLRADHARPGHPHDRADRLGRRRPGRARCWRPRSPSRRRSRSCCSAATTSRRSASAPGPRAFLDGAGPAAIGAILGAAVLLAGGARGAVAVGRARARRRARARARPLAAARAAGRRGRGRAHHYDHLMADALQEETADVLARLIQFNTVNPPGDERACQEWLRDYLTEAGLECELDGTRARAPEPRRARSPGERARARCSATSRTSTPCSPTAEDWTHDPWSGEIHDGHLWGRGALDMKSQTAAEAVAAARLAREGWRPAKGALKVFSVVDEETGGDQGRQVAVREPARPRPRRLPAQRGRRHGDAVRRPPPARRLLRREGHVPLRRARPRPRRPRLRARDRRQRAAQARAGARAARLPPAALRRHRRAARVPARDRRRPGRPGGRARAHRARSSRGWPRCSSRRSASPSRRRSSPRARRST